MNQSVRLDDVDRYRFTDAVEASLEVWSRQQFFVWTQSSLQGLVPHEILLCGVRDPANQSMLLQHFSASRYFRQEHFHLVADPGTGLLPRLMAVSEDGGESIVFSPLAVDRLSNRQLDALVASNEMKNLAATLLSGIGGQVEAFYGFARVSVAFDSRLRRCIDLMAPHIHSTFLRVLSKEREAAGSVQDKSERVITPRQAQIMCLVRDGKTNAEIAELLGCSQWTVKNHIQNILRRLGTNSRAHAIVLAMRLGVLRAD